MEKKKDIVAALKEILHEGSASSQENIKSSLKQAGFDINQSKISRLLRKLGAIKTTNEHNEIVYALPYDPSPLTSKNILSQLVVNISRNENLIVIRTNPGSASLIGRVLDHHSVALQILGTVAGDDTVFIAPVSVTKIDKTLKLVKEVLANVE